jgi:hypothetical protein
MNQTEWIVGVGCFVTLIGVLYNHIGWRKLKEVYSMWFTKEYWTDYNTVEFLSWLAKAVIIVPGLIFGIQLWWLYWFTLFTSATLVWASYRKLLPTLVGFNTIWIFISIMVLTKHLV